MLSKHTPRIWELGRVTALPVAADSTLYQGAAVGDNGEGQARPLQAGDRFLGFCEDVTFNVAHLPQSTETDKTAWVRVLTSGLVELEVAGLKASSLQAVVTAIDDSSFSLSGFPNSPIGRVHRITESGSAIVAFGSSAAPLLSPYRLITAGSHTTTGGSPIEKIPLQGIVASDLVHVTLAALGKAPVSLLCATAGLNKLQLTFSGDPGKDHVLHYQVMRAV